MNADSVIQKLQEQVQTLTARQWPEISRIVEDEDEINLSFSIKLTPDEAKTTLSYSQRHKDTVESVLNDPKQGEFPLNGPSHVPKIGEDGEPIPLYAHMSSIAAEDAGETPLGDVIGAAAANSDQPPLSISLDDPGWTVKGLRSDFKIRAKKAKWPVAAIDLMLQVIDAIGDNLGSVKETLRPHTVAGQHLVKPTASEIEGFLERVSSTQTEPIPGFNTVAEAEEPLPL